MTLRFNVFSIASPTFYSNTSVKDLNFFEETHASRNLFLSRTRACGNSWTVYDIRMTRTIIQIIILISLAGCTFSPQSKIKTNGPIITFDHEEFDFGKVSEGVELQHTFQIKNAGNQPLENISTYSTCGCTTPKLSKTSLKPGESIELPVHIDTSMKQNEVEKTVNVSSDDPERPLVILSLQMEVEDRHKGLSKRQKAKILTDEKCTGCHVAQGVGTFGKELYEADCAMCHGDKAEGKVGPSLLRDFSDKSVKEHLWAVTAYGSKHSVTMPGFLVDAGGPLAKEQVDSIIEYLEKLQRQKP